jgi:hypothetical protein
MPHLWQASDDSTSRGCEYALFSSEYRMTVCRTQREAGAFSLVIALSIDVIDLKIYGTCLDLKKRVPDSSRHFRETLLMSEDSWQ